MKSVWKRVKNLDKHIISPNTIATLTKETGDEIRTIINYVISSQ